MILMLALLVSQPIVEEICSPHCVSIKEATQDLDEANTELEKCQQRWGLCKRQKERLDPIALLPAPCPEIDYKPIILPAVGVMVIVAVVTFVIGFAVGNSGGASTIP